MPLMGFRQYARHRGVTLRAVQKAIEAGRITVVGEGAERRIDSAMADAAWRANTDPGAQSLLYSAGPAARAASAPAIDPSRTESASARADDEPAPPDQTSEYRAERAKRERIRRERDEIELEELRGNLIALAEVEVTVYTAFRTLRDAMLQVGTRVKDRCASTADPFMVEQIIEAEVAATFARFDPAKMAQPPDDDDEDARDTV